MCGRFTLRTPPTEIASLFSVQLPIEFQKTPYVPRYNIAPSQQITVILQDHPEDAEFGEAGSTDSERLWKLFRWGLIPSWAKDTKIGYKLINARGETLGEKPSFRNAFKKRRCLILADGFYEWKKTSSGKVPFHFGLDNGGVMAFAGLWERWKKDDPTLYSCTIVTTEANELLGKLHDRMPVILDAADHDKWLDPEFQNTEELQSLLQPYSADEMVSREANPIVNHVKNETPECLEEPPPKEIPNELF